MEHDSFKRIKCFSPLNFPVEACRVSRSFDLQLQCFQSTANHGQNKYMTGRRDGVNERGALSA